MLWCEALYGTVAHSADTSNRIVELFPAHTHSTAHTVSYYFVAWLRDRSMWLAYVHRVEIRIYATRLRPDTHSLASVRRCAWLAVCSGWRRCVGVGAVFICDMWTAYSSVHIVDIRNVTLDALRIPVVWCGVRRDYTANGRMNADDVPFTMASLDLIVNGLSNESDTGVY